MRADRGSGTPSRALSILGEVETLHVQEIASLVVAPIERDGRLVGFLGMDNPPADQIRDIAPLLRTLCYFYSMTLQRIENERQLVAIELSRFSDRAVQSKPLQRGRAAP